MNYNAARALELLRQGTGNPAAAFRDGQEEAIRHLVEGKSRLLVVQKTGWGKSSVYFIATRLLREGGEGPALLVSPLLALMRNQIAAAGRMGVRALTIHSENVDEWGAVEQAIAGQQADIVLISPERLANDRFREQVLGPIAKRISLLVVDEAHCISDWGHDFRPHYRLLEKTVRKLPPHLRLLATTATANNRVLDDLVKILGPNLTVSRGELNRASLLLQTIAMPDQAARLAWLAEQVPKMAGSGIIYTLTVRDANQVAEWLKTREIVAEAYTGETGDARVAREDALLANRVKALVATPALGMGFDKPDLAFVVHYQTPGSVVAYYQQVGRAGRALNSAYGVLLSGSEETEINDYFIESAFPSQKEVREVLDALGAEPMGLSIYELMERINVSFGRITKTLLLLSLEEPAPIVKREAKWLLGAAPLGDGFWERAERLTSLRRTEQRQMQAYVQLKSGHMEFLVQALDGEPQVFHPPVLPLLPITVEPALVRAASSFLKQNRLVVEPRKKWPVGGLTKKELKGKIDEARQAREGRALCVWSDAGWGALARRGMERDGRFDDELVQASEELIRTWSPRPAPEWVTCIPSFRHPELVPDFARRLSVALNLPFHPVLTRPVDRPLQKDMANGSQKARNLEGSLAIRKGPLPAGAVLLVDDLVDSRWTLTAAAYLLTLRGSGAVHPFVLATTGYSSG